MIVHLFLLGFWHVSMIPLVFCHGGDGHDDIKGLAYWHGKLDDYCKRTKNGNTKNGGKPLFFDEFAFVYSSPFFMHARLM